MAQMLMKYHNARLAKGSPPAVMADFMLADPLVRQRAREDNLIAGLRALAVPSKKSRKRQLRRRQGKR